MKLAVLARLSCELAGALRLDDGGDVYDGFGDFVGACSPCSLTDMPSGIVIALITLAVLASSLYYLVKGEGGVDEAWQQLQNGYEVLVEG